MAMPSSLYLFVLGSILFALSFNAISTSYVPKSLHFTLYQHDSFNESSFLIVDGVAGTGLSPTTALVGSLFVTLDPLTVRPDPSSKVVGTSQGFFCTTSFDGLSNLGSQRMELSYKNHKGSFSLVGNLNSIKPSEIPIMGGTGDFLFVQGYVKYSLVSVKGFVIIYKAEFHLYWPPYTSNVPVLASYLQD